jgi:hypothetical protein
MLLYRLPCSTAYDRRHQLQMCGAAMQLTSDYSSCNAGTFSPKQLNQLKTAYKSSIDYVTSDKRIKVWVDATWFLV